MSHPFDLALREIEQRSHLPLVLETPVPVEMVPTPALLLDEQRLERNIATMATYLSGKDKGFRPHAKTHKCPLISQRQLAAGAVGVCAAKVSEAVALVNGGVTSVLITSPITNPFKAGIVARLAQSAKMAIVVDQLAGVELLASAVGEGVTLDVLIDIDIEMGRTGTRDDDELLRLAQAITAADGLNFKGVQHYAGHVMHIEGFAARRERSLGLWERVAAKCDLLAEKGFTCEVVTGCGTGTYNIDSDVALITDLQVGSYIFMDQEYRLIGGQDSELFDDFEVSLTLLATAISQPTSKTITVDGGYKVFASDSVNPEPLDLAGSRFRFAGDEHGVLILPDGYQEPLLGSVQRFITPHCDPTVNLHDAYWVHRDGMVVERWPITARGCSW
jgi:3-hydroxy-D-aspartate aldolase